MSAALRASGRFQHSRFLQGYAEGKTRWDPAYPAVAELFGASQNPLLDVGCGMGLLAAYLRESGCRQPILGIDPDREKIRTAVQHVASVYPLLEFREGDARELPEFSGDVVLLDVLHYMEPEVQRRVLEEVARRICPGGRAVIRTTFRDRSWRYYATLLEEGVVRVSGWIRGGKCRFPTLEEVTAPFKGRQWNVSVRPMWGRTPFNSHLVEIRRGDDGL